MENVPKVIKINEKSPGDPEEKQKEEIFRIVILNKIADQLEGSMFDHDFSQEEVDEFKKYLAELPETEALGVVAIPWELQPRLFSRYRERIDKGECTIKQMVEALHNQVIKKGYTTGFHLSDHQIKKIKRANNQEGWDVKGTELDDRDDMKMAYYSLDYAHLFRKRAMKYLYLVRAEMGPQTDHKRDKDNNWGRTTSLSIIDEFSLREIDGEVGKIYSQLPEDDKKEKIAA